MSAVRSPAPDQRPADHGTRPDAGRGDVEDVVATERLTKRYGRDAPAVRELDLRVRRGEVYGFLGPNGAGKTTTLRMLTGLIRPTAGTATVLGRTPGTRGSLTGVGALIEEPGFYPFLSGRDNLRVVARRAGLPVSRVGPVLEQVDLPPGSRQRVGAYSTGMTKRLGVAAALLKDPELLVLDEPTSGLDPAGIVEMRDLVRRLGGERSVLLCSHLMTEVEQTCDRVGIVRAGRLLTEGTVEELRGRRRLRLRASPAERARAVLASLPYVAAVGDAAGALAVDADPSRVGDLTRDLVEAGVAVLELTTDQTSLEQVFLDLVETKG